MLFLGKLLATDSISLLVIMARKTVPLTLWDAPLMALKRPVAMESALWKGPRDGSWKWPLADSQQEVEARSPRTTGTERCQLAHQFGRKALKAESLMGLQPRGHICCTWWDLAQRTLLTCAQSPNPQKFWGHKCVLFCTLSLWYHCYAAIDNW